MVNYTGDKLTHCAQILKTVKQAQQFNDYLLINIEIFFISKVYTFFDTTLSLEFELFLQRWHSKKWNVNIDTDVSGVKAFVGLK